MAKQTTEKKEFAWDTEKLIGEFGDAKKKTEVRICTLNDKTYVSAQSYVMSAKTGDWKRTKNNTMEMSVFAGVQDMVSKWTNEDTLPKKAEKTEEAPKPKKETAAQKKKREQAELKAQRESLEDYAAKLNGTEPVKGTHPRKNSKKTVTGIEKK